MTSDIIKTEATLATANEMLISVLNGMESIVYAVDNLTHEIVFVNKYAERSLNKQIKVGGVCWKELECGQEESCGFRNERNLDNESEKSTGVHVREYQNTANHCWYHVQDHAIRWTDGRPVRLEIATDITKQKEQEAFGLQRQADVCHATRLNVAGEMASGLAHELSQPLAAANTYLQGCLGLIESGQHDMEQLSTAIKSAYIQTERAGKIVTHLRNFIHKGGNDREWVDINQLALGAIHFLDHEIRRSRIDVSLNFSVLPPFHANPVELEQVLINLLKNAIESMQAAPIRELGIKTRLLDFTAFEVEISDTGKGMPESEIGQIFNPFSSSKKDGLGLGLSICRIIVESYGGQIRVSSSLNSGSIFTVSLPPESHA